MGQNTEQHLDIIVSGKDQSSDAIRALEKVRKKAKETEEESKKSSASGRFFGLKNLKTGLGEESEFGGAAKILAGTGAVAGLSLAGRELSAMADRATELRRELSDGSKSAGEVAESLAKSIPIFGDIIDSGRKFRALIDGTAADLDRLARENSLGKILDNISATLQGLKKIREEGEDAARHVRQQAGLVGLVDPKRTLQQLKDEREETVRLIAKNKEDIAKQIKDQSASDVSALQKAVQEAAQRTGEARAKYQYGQAAYGEIDLYTKGARDDLNIALREQSAAELALRQKALVLKQQTATQITAANGQLSEKLTLLDKQRDVVQDAANQERERREVAHFQTMNTIRGKAQTEALQIAGNTTQALIAQQQTDFRAATAAAAQTFREGLREALHGGPDSPAKVVANFLEESFGRRQAYENTLRRTVAVGIGTSIVNGISDALGKAKDALQGYPQNLLRLIGLSPGPQSAPSIVAQADRTALPQSRFLTGTNQAPFVSNQPPPDSVAQKATADQTKDLRDAAKSFFDWFRVQFNAANAGTVGDVFAGL